jgi:hypothetical protein
MGHMGTCCVALTDKSRKLWWHNCTTCGGVRSQRAMLETPSERLVVLNIHSTGFWKRFGAVDRSHEMLGVSLAQTQQKVKTTTYRSNHSIPCCGVNSPRAMQATTWHHINGSWLSLLCVWKEWSGIDGSYKMSQLYLVGLERLF